MPKTAGSGESHGASSAVWRWPCPSRASQTRRWRSKFIPGRDSPAGEGAGLSCESARDGPVNPRCYFCPNLGFLEVVFLLAASRRERAGLESPTACGAILSRVNGCSLPTLGRLRPLAERGAGSSNFPFPFPASGQASEGLQGFQHPIPQKFLSPPGSFPLGAWEKRGKAWLEVDVAEKALQPWEGM